MPKGIPGSGPNGSKTKTQTAKKPGRKARAQTVLVEDVADLVDILMQRAENSKNADIGDAYEEAARLLSFLTQGLRVTRA